MSHPATFVYFIGPIIGGPVKIGFSRNPGRRMLRLSEGAPFPLQLLCAAPGTIYDEKRVHAEFAASRAHGEWFHRTPELIDLISCVKLTGALPSHILSRPIPRRLLTRTGVKRTPEQCARIGAGVRRHHAWISESIRIAREKYERSVAARADAQERVA